MARIRTIKPEFWTSPQMVACSIHARLLFIGLWNFSDDAGIHPASPPRLKMEVFPWDNFTQEMVEDWIKELLRNRLIIKYCVLGEYYWQVTGWKNQRIDRPYYRFPPPDQGEIISIPLSECSATRLSPIDESSTNSIRIVNDKIATVHPRNGMEGNGKNIDNCQVSDETLSCDSLNLPPSPIKRDSQKREVSASDDVVVVFQYWKATMQHPRAKLDKQRISKIEQALKLGYSITDLKQAINGCAGSPFNMGDNERKQRYVGIQLIFRDAEHIERFMAVANGSLSTVDGVLNRHSQTFEGVL